MRKLVLFAFIFGVLFSVTSCAQDECECTANGVTETFTEEDVNSGSVEEACTAANLAYTAPDECHMK